MTDCIRKTMALVSIATSVWAIQAAIACEASYEKPTDLKAALCWDVREKLTQNLVDESG